jgi:TRAP-type mannitol/chloroaromatic compound transport system permease small subunit
MQALLKLSRGIDWLNTQVGKYVIWLILASTFISGVNAMVRKVFNVSSNAFLEVQWYLFAASFLLAAGYTLLQGEHVKVDVISSRCPSARRSGSTCSAFIVFLTPMCMAVLWYGIPFFTRACLGRNVEQRRRPDPLAGVPDDAAGLRLLCCKAGLN